MILVFVDIMDKEAIPFDSNFREKLMKKYNLFFEFIREKELYSIPIQGLVMEKEEKNISKSLNQHRYAKLIFDKIIRYFPIIEDEIIFNNHSDNINKISNPLMGSKKIERFAKKTLIKDIYNYDYLSRHSIYFERSLIFKEISGDFKERRPVIVEFGAFNSLITHNVIEESEKAFLFTESFHAYEFMKKLNKKCKLFGDNVNIKLYSLDLLNVVNECLNQINKKADVIVVGFGLGSRISNLTEFIRYIYSWLSDTGVLFISFYNQDYFDLINSQNRKANKPITALYSRLGYEKKKDSPLLKNYKSYSVKNIKTAVLKSFKETDIDIYTYPYLSGIIKINEYDRSVLDEIREADKNHAKQGKFGQFIYAIAHKKDEEVKNESSKNEELIIFLEKHRILYYEKKDHFGPDSNGLLKSLEGEDDFLKDTLLLKTVVLYKKDKGYSSEKEWIYIILPCNYSVNYSDSKYALVPENVINGKFGQRVISPVSIFMLKEERADSQYDNLFFSYRDSITTNYILVTGRANKGVIKLKKDDFFALATEMGVKLENQFI